MSDFDDWMKAQEPAPAPQTMPYEEAKGRVGARYGARDQLEARLGPIELDPPKPSAESEEAIKSNMPGYQPKAYAEGAPESKRIATEASLASAARAETKEEKATRELNAEIAGIKHGIPFYPRMAGLWRGQFELAKQTLQRLTGRTDFTAKEIWEEAKRANDEQFKSTHETIQKDMAGSPVHAAFGSIPTMMLTPGGLPAKTAASRVLGGAALGGVYGASAMDRPGATAEELGVGATLGAPLGAAGAAAGEALRILPRGAAHRNEQQFIRELSRLEGGEGAQALLARNKVGIAKAYEEVLKQRTDPAIKAAIKMPEGKGVEVIDKKLAPFNSENDRLYAWFDELARDLPQPPKIAPPPKPPRPVKEPSGEVGLRGTVAKWSPEGEITERVVDPSKLRFPKATRGEPVARWSPEGERIPVEVVKIPKKKTAPLPKQPKATAQQAGPKRAGLMNSSRLEHLLEKAKDNVSPEAAEILSDMQFALRKHWVPKVWKGETSMPTKRFREWLTYAQRRAEMSPGGLNWTATYEIKQEAKNEAARIFNEYLDSVPEAAQYVARIRENNALISPVLRIRDALETKGAVEKLQRMGLGKMMEEAHRSTERAGAIASVFAGRPDIAAAIAAKPYVEKGVRRTLKWMNENVWEPMQVMAENGEPKAVLARFAIERGIPSGMANTLADRFAPKFRPEPSDEQDKSLMETLREAATR